MQRCQEQRRAKRLLHESRHALTGKALVHLVLAIAAHHNDAHIWPQLLQVPQDFLAVHLWHSQI